MSDAEPKRVVVERQVAHPPEKVWRALTQSELIAEWLMQTTFRPEVGHRFALTADWGTVDCEVLEVETARRLSYRWASGAMDSVVTWTLTPEAGGTRLRMEQVGFPADVPQYYGGARAGWPRFLDALEHVLAGLP